MTKKHSTKRSLIASILVLCLCLSTLIGTTFAWFTDSVTSGGNIIKSGTLDVTMEWFDGTKAVPDADSDDWTDASTGAIFNSELWEPGYTAVRHIKIANEGTLALKYAFKIVADGEIGELAEVIDVYYVDPAAQIDERSDLTPALKLGTLAQILADMSTASGNLEAGENHTVTLALKMQESAGNEYQNKQVAASFTIQLLATQLTAEEDSFDDQYDKDAILPALNTAAKEENEEVEVATEEVSIEVPATAPAGNYTVEVNKVGKTTDAEGNTTLAMDINLKKDGVKVEATEGVDYIVEIEVGKNLVITGVSHNGEAVSGYSYNPTTGIITFTTESFSPFAVSYSENTIRVSSYEELCAALEAIRVEAKTQIPGAEGNKAFRVNAIIVLEDDIVIDADSEFMYTDSNGAPLHIYGMKGIIDLNGHNITVSSDALLAGKAHANAVLLFQYSNVSIIGEGSIISNNKSIPVYAWANCTVDIYGGNYVTNASERNESAVYVNNKTALVNVYGGTYTGSAYAFNVHDTSCAGTPVIVLHEGISYADFLKGGTVDVTKSDLDGGRIVLADGCELVKDDNNINTVTKN